MEENFLGYCFLEVDGNHLPPTKLKGADSILNYALRKSNLFPEIRITDMDDLIVMHVVNGELIHPLEFKVKFAVMKEGLNP